MKTLVLYHANCYDGFCSAWVYWHCKNKNAEFIPVSYGQDPPDVNGKDVIILDFSYKRDVILKMKEEANSILVLDHHKTAQKELEGLDFCVFDMERSGAQLTWDYFNPEEKRPWIVDYVADRDLWKWELRSSKEVNTWIQNQPFEFEWWETFIKHDYPGSERIEMGEAILYAYQKFIDNAVKSAYIIEFDGYKVPVVNTTVLHSEIGNELAKIHPFAITYFDKENERICSLRSVGDFDVSEIAKKHGGGGHKNAAGFTIKTGPFNEYK